MLLHVADSLHCISVYLLLKRMMCVRALCRKVKQTDYPKEQL